MAAVVAIRWVGGRVLQTTLHGAFTAAFVNAGKGRAQQQYHLVMCKSWAIHNSLDVGHSQILDAWSGLQGAAELVGRKIGELCLARKIEKVSFDRGGNVYHGRVKVGCCYISHSGWWQDCLWLMIVSPVVMPTWLAIGFSA